MGNKELLRELNAEIHRIASAHYERHARIGKPGENRLDKEALAANGLYADINAMLAAKIGPEDNGKDK